MPKQRQIIIVAGPNGAGKTTFAREYLLKEAHCPEQRMSIGFEWDPKKAKTNLAKHGISFEEALTSSPIPWRESFLIGRRIT
jgi:predicted ABC-type ATPase